MGLDRNAFRDSMVAANRAIVALESVELRNDKAASALVGMDGVDAYKRLLDLRNSSKLMPADAELAQTALDLLRAKLRYFGYAI